MTDWRDRLQALMNEKGFNMKRLSLAAGLNETYVRDAIKRDRRPSIENAGKIAGALGIKVSDLFEGTPPLDPDEAELLVLFARMPPSKRQRLLGIAESYAAQSEEDGDAPLG